MRGGIKSRKSNYYEYYMQAGGYDACVTTGGIQSNHNRAIALMCARHGWKCHIVFHGSAERFEHEKGNALLVRESGASYEFVEAEEISAAMDNAIIKMKKEGLKPLYIHGGGHDIPGGMALVDAVKSLKKQCDEFGYKPRHIFHASGTGSTQAGILVGLDAVGWSDVKVTGISVARQHERGVQVIEEFANRLARHCGVEKDYTGKIDFRTDYLAGGYENTDETLSAFVGNAIKKTGIPFDTTYSGKALFGMFDCMEKENITDGVMFWHTGGLMNLMK